MVYGVPAPGRGKHLPIISTVSYDLAMKKASGESQPQDESPSKEVVIDVAGTITRPQVKSKGGVETIPSINLMMLAHDNLVVHVKVIYFPWEATTVKKPWCWSSSDCRCRSKCLIILRNQNRRGYIFESHLFPFRGTEVKPRLAADVPRNSGKSR